MGHAAILKLKPGQSSREPPWASSAGPIHALLAATPRAPARMPRVLGRSVFLSLAISVRLSRWEFVCHYFSQYKQLQTVYTSKYDLSLIHI